MLAKSVMVVIFSWALVANAASLDQLLSQQTETIINPVQFKGAPVAYSYPRVANVICGMFGYSRLLTSKTTAFQCHKGIQLAQIDGAPGVVSSLELTVCSGDYQLQVMDEIICAR